MDSATNADIAARLQAILQRPEFKPTGDQRIWEWLREFFRWFAPWLSGLSPLLRGIIAAACVAVLAAVGWHLWLIYHVSPKRRRTTAAGRGATDAVGMHPEALLARARDLAEAGQVRDAARALQQAVFMHICHDRGLVWQPALADWEWLQRLQPAAEVVTFTRAAQRLAFGPEPTLAAFAVCARQAAAACKSSTVFEPAA